MTPENNLAAWQNPFAKYRLEDWRVEEFPENYKELVACFAPPDFMEKLEDPSIGTALIIMGGRGSGKSHVLRMISVQSVIKDLELKLNTEKLVLEDYNKGYFGIYLKCDCFSPLSLENITFTEDMIKPFFEHFFNLQIVKTILDVVRFFCSSFSNLPEETETEICSKLCKWNTIFKGNTFLDLIEALDAEMLQVRNFVKLFPYEKDFSVFRERIHFTNTPEFLQKIFNIIREQIKTLEDKILFILLDEYEEMDIYQQKLVNGLIKGRKFSFRIASKIDGIKTLEYAKEKKLDEIHDYEIIPLHFNVSREKIVPYRNLARQIFSNRLKLYENYKEKEPEKLLPSPTLSDEGLTEDEINSELKKIRANLTRKKEIKEPEKYWSYFEGHYREAAVYRLLRNRGKEKLYAGFDEYVSLSSGIVRLFILLCREAFTLAHQKGVRIEEGRPIDVITQSRAAREVSKIELTITIPKNVSTLYGQKLARFILDIGSILRAKLHFSTQPQANRIEIIDSEKFELEEYRIPRELIQSGLDLPVFLSEVSFKTRDIKSPMPQTFSLNWIFAPLLEIPPEERWRTELRASELKNLCSTETREETLTEIISQIQKKRRIIHKHRGPQPVTLESFDKREPISLINCPVTGSGCNQNLEHYLLAEKEPTAFLAVPFDRGNWVYDPRLWIKESMHEDFNIRCVDVADMYPKGGKILCKICSCVRQMPIGLFEITELNPNVIFELGMSTALNKLNFLLVYPEKIPKAHRGNFPPKPLENIEFIPYELSRNAINKAIKENIMPTIEAVKKRKKGITCWTLKAECPHKTAEALPNAIFVGLPFDRNPEFFGELEKQMQKILKQYKIKFYHPARTLSELCQMCKAIKASSFCVVDTTYNDTSMLFALGCAFGKDKSFVQLHDIGLFPQRPISDLRDWAIEYPNLSRLKNLLLDELPKRLRGLEK